MATSRESTMVLKMNSMDDCISEHTLQTIEQFEQESKGIEIESCCPYFSRWWNSQFAHQNFIVHTVEKTIFHVVIIILVLIDCLLVVGELMLDFIYLSEKCDNKTRSVGSEEVKNHELEFAIEVLHYASIILLSIFVFEIMIKIYAFGKKWWNIREKKMEWVDALIVIVSFIIDVYFLKRPSVIAEISLLFISFRLWRIVRIINSVAQSVRSKDEKGKKYLTNTYVQIIELLVNVSVKKTDAASKLRQDLRVENLDHILEQFTSIDQTCRALLAQCQTPKPRTTLAEIAQNLQATLEQVRLSSSTLGLTNQSYIS